MHEVKTKKSAGLVFIPLFMFVYFFILKIEIQVPNKEKILFLGLLFFMIIGFLDDKYNLKVRIRLGIEFLFLYILLYKYSSIDSIQLFFKIEFSKPIIDFLLTLFLLGIVNLVNFMDGLDSYLSSSILVFFIIYLNIHSGPELVLLFGFFSLSLIGFIFFNKPKAKLFMGDVGSLPIGYLLGVLILFPENQIPKNSFHLENLFFILPVFIIDGTLTILIRIYRKENIFRAHREHLYQLVSLHLVKKEYVPILFSSANFISLAFYHLVQNKFYSILFLYILFIFIYLVLYRKIRMVISHNHSE
jgi:UDP-N-acetylmuramyl pentapeptide phosphotransferase/UDP-N-acetylglucosamine-1-phosphate transferase